MTTIVPKLFHEDDSVTIKVPLILLHPRFEGNRFHSVPTFERSFLERDYAPRFLKELVKNLVGHNTFSERGGCVLPLPDGNKEQAMLESDSDSGSFELA